MTYSLNCHETRKGSYLNGACASQTLTEKIYTDRVVSGNGDRIGRSPMFDISGNDDTVIPAIDFQEGTYSISVINKEPLGFFAVKLIRSDGRDIEFLLNETAEFAETFEFEIGRLGGVMHQDGIWTMDIDASGDWGISIR